MDRSTGRLRSLAFTSLAHFTNDGTVFFVPVIAAILAANHGVSPLVLTLLFLVFYASSAVLSPFVGRLADRLGSPATLMGFGLGILSAGLFGFYLALSETSGPSLVAALLLAALLTGSGSAFYHPLGASLLQAAFRDGSMGIALGVNGALGSLGRALYPSLYFVAAAAIAGYGAIALFALIGLAAALVIWLGVRVPASVRTAAAPPASRSSEAITRGIVALTAVAFLRSAATQGIASWVPTYLATQQGLGVGANLGLTLTVMYAAAVIGQPIFGLLVDRFEKRAVLGASSAGAAASILGYLAAPAGPVGLAWLFVFGFFTFSGFPLLLSMAADYVPRGSSSLGNALVWGIGVGVGGAVGPLLTGVLIGSDYGRLDFAFTVLAGAALLSALATALIPRAARQSHMPAFG
ncbi:MAG: MFS transporter [Candidatus Limnocylindrales bacterium]